MARVSAPETLSAYPWVIVRVCCETCGRRGQFRLARLAAKYGPERPLLEVLAAMSADCRARNPTSYDEAQGWNTGCGARFKDLPDGRPPDLPPGMPRLRLVEGGKPIRPHGFVERWKRNPRRAYDREGLEITPPTIGDHRAAGDPMFVTAYCGTIGCGHEARIDVSGWPDDVFIPDISLHVRCSHCGRKGSAHIMPQFRDWRDRPKAEG